MTSRNCSQPPQRHHAVRRMLSYAARRRGKITLIALCGLLASLANVSLPFFFGRAVDHITGAGQVNFAGLANILVLLGGLVVVLAVSLRFVGYLSAVISQIASAELRKEAAEKINRLPLSYIDSHPHGNTVSCFVNDCEAIAEGLYQGLMQVFTGIVTVLGTLGFMMALSPLTTLVVVVITLLAFLVSFFVTRLSNRYFRHQQDCVGDLLAVSGELIAGSKTVRLFGYQARAEARFAAINSRLYTVGQKAQFVSSLSNPTTRFVGHLATVAVVVLGGIYGGLSIGGIASFLTFAALFSRPFSDITAIAAQLAAAAASSVRIFELMDQPAEAADPSDSPPLPDIHGRVDFEKIWFSYRPDMPLIRDFSLHVRPGMRVAVVGPTGAGKTTLVNLLMRFYEIDRGVIKVEGVNTRLLPRQTLRRCFGMVLQETWLFSGTVRDNIAYAKPDATQPEIEAAARAAYAHSFISKLSGGYDTVLSSDGRELSAGQKQLLTIARVMLMNPPMLILDEATSSVDTLTERRIQRVFNAMMKGKTSFIIAHRLSTIRDADLILVMRDGQIAEQGNHDQLLKKGGFYTHLYNSQFMPTVTEDAPAPNPSKL